MFPPGAQKGTTVEITFRGRRLEDVSVIQFLHPGIQAEVCHAEAYELVAIVSIGKEVPPGIPDYRMIGKDGATAGAFPISDLPNEGTQ